METNKLRNLIKKVIRQKLSKDSRVVLDYEKFPILNKYPEIKDLLVDLMTEQYDLFIKEIQWVAPRPTTLKIILANNQFFFLEFNERSWIASIEGKKYYLLDLQNEENAIKAISRLLKYGIQDIEKPEIENQEATEEPEPKDEN